MQHCIALKRGYVVLTVLRSRNLLVVCEFNDCILNVGIYTVSHKKLDPFSFEHNFDKYCPVLIIFFSVADRIQLRQSVP